ncbi:hypothetical protein H5410_010394 [Solanum commersonii]|uniref:Uncharacterized protein n=1 Tax=Solanum commersonii TaxID=4109 RepID=A0A9J6AKK0_SOLCO|nr:hypothetical protein H5410_010394 [Solanum commersonii]
MMNNRVIVTKSRFVYFTIKSKAHNPNTQKSQKILSLHRSSDSQALKKFLGRIIVTTPRLPIKLQNQAIKWLISSLVHSRP